MKAKLTVTIAEELIPKAKSYARRKGRDTFLSPFTAMTSGALVIRTA
jgi:hypothetical protein